MPLNPNVDPYYATGITTTVVRSGVLHVADPGAVDQKLYFHRFTPDGTNKYPNSITGISHFDPNLSNPGWNFYYYDTGNVILVDLNVDQPPYRFVITKSPALVAILANASGIPSFYPKHAVLGGPPAIYDNASMLLGFKPTGDVGGGVHKGFVDQDTPSYSIPDFSSLFPQAPVTSDTPYLPGISSQTPSIQQQSSTQQFSQKENISSKQDNSKWIIVAGAGVTILSIGAIYLASKR